MSRLQELFLRELAATFRATKSRIVRRLAEAQAEKAAEIIEDELRGLYHGVLVVFDGGTALAEEGMLRIVDEDGEEFDCFLHEICFDFLAVG